MRAGKSPKEDDNNISVRPTKERDKRSVRRGCGVRQELGTDSEVELMANENDSDADDEGMIKDYKTGVDPERIALPKDGEHVRKIIDPKLPSKEEVEHHNLTHLPYRNWCPICVKAKGKDMDHKDASDKQRTVSEYCLD